MKRLLIIVVGIAIVLGMKYWKKDDAHDEVKAHVVSLCAGNSDCQEAVERDFDACFQESYRMGGQGQASRVKERKLVQCLTRRSGVEYFAAGAGEW